MHYFEKEQIFAELVKVNSWYDEFDELHDLALDYRIKSIQSSVLKYHSDIIRIIRREKFLMIYWDFVHYVITMKMS